MSAVPPAIPDVGATTQRLAQNPRFDPLKAGFGTEEYFVWSRFDGITTLKDLILMTGLPTDRAIDIVRTLWQRGAIVAGPEPSAGAARGTGTLPAVSRVSSPPPTTRPPPVARVTTQPAVARVTAPPPVARVPTPPPVARVPTPPSVARTTTPPRSTMAPPVGLRPPASSVAPSTARPAISPTRSTNDETHREPGLTVVAPIPELTAPTGSEQRALAEPSAMSESDRRRVLAGLRLVSAGDPWQLLGVPRGSDKRALKRAFFERSKLFHPDRYYGKEIGAYAGRLFTVFEAITSAHADLTDGGQSRRNTGSAAATAPQTPAEYAAELFDRACVAEVSGDPPQALKLFAAAVKLDGQARYLRRAAECALAGGELRTAEDYAKKAVALEGSDPSMARILGKVLRQLGKFESAEEVLVMALAMKSENDTLMRELAAELRAVRADLVR